MNTTAPYLCLSITCPHASLCQDRGDCFEYIVQKQDESQGKLLINAKNSPAPKRREIIFKRDNYTCLCCGEDDRSKLTIDHIVPKSKGGKNTEDNLQTLCNKCNGSKANSIRDYRQVSISQKTLLGVSKKRTASYGRN